MITMNHSPGINELDLADGADPGQADLQALGLVGCIDRLTVPLRDRGTGIRWEAPHHAMEVKSDTAILLYQVARRVLHSIVEGAETATVHIRLASTNHGIRLSIAEMNTSAEFKPALENHRGTDLDLMCRVVELAGGDTVIDLGSGMGTRVTVTLPLD